MITEKDTIENEIKAGVEKDTENECMISISVEEYKKMNDYHNKLLELRREERKRKWVLSKNRLPEVEKNILMAAVSNYYKDSSPNIKVMLGKLKLIDEKYIWARDNGEHRLSVFAWKYADPSNELKELAKML